MSSGVEGKELLQFRPGEVANVLLALDGAAHDRPPQTVLKNLAAFGVSFDEATKGGRTAVNNGKVALVRLGGRGGERRENGLMPNNRKDTKGKQYQCGTTPEIANETSPEFFPLYSHSTGPFDLSPPTDREQPNTQPQTQKSSTHPPPAGLGGRCHPQQTIPCCPPFVFRIGNNQHHLRDGHGGLCAAVSDAVDCCGFLRPTLSLGSGTTGAPRPEDMTT